MSVAKLQEKGVSLFFRQDEMGVGIALALLILFFSLLSPDFLSLRTWGSIATFGSVLGVMAIGSTLLMIVGEFDLSVGSIVALSGMIFSMGVVKWGWSSYSAAFVALLAGVMIGFLNGFITLFTGIPSFITTLGSMLIWRGVVLAISGGFPISLVDDRTGVLLWFGTKLGDGFFTAVLWWFGLAMFCSWLLKHSAFGNHLFATGGSATVARGMGVNTTYVKMVCFILSGFLSALTGLIFFSELQDISPTAGESYELYAIACAVIGGTSLKGGAGTVIGTVLGTLLIGVVQAGLVHIGIDSYWFRTFVGVLLVIAVTFNINLRRFSEST